MMDSTIDRAIWLLTGGKEPKVHSAILRKRKSKINTLQISNIEPSISQYFPVIGTTVNKFKYHANINLMPLEGHRAVHVLIPFHTVKLPVFGLTLPTIQVKTRLKRFSPSILMSSLLFKINRPENISEEVFIKTNINHEKYQKLKSFIITIPLLAKKINVKSVEPHEIPEYFIRIRPVSSIYLKPIELASRRIIFAKTLGVPKDKVQVIAIFKDIEQVSHESIKFDEISKSLICKFASGRKKTHKICDVIVGRNLLDNKTHILLYKK